ncbi:hypothetical protein ER308_12365 [Egibacter rhizosphaerae]|uniref:Uncharacterized protein n=1 Tax=Egibacter rhizosphaerae TaxID=1670831 RepID=A0A411YGF2_9ACTN|nr:hypothetical protein [Egibacter rhizosphaerae]QBI20283.1 hypothetical protein ER308_12365 [Egibacter rhizosphaerae]
MSRARRAQVLLGIVARDALNLARYGTDAPRWGLRIWVSPASCEGWVRGFTSEHSGLVKGGDWDLSVERTLDHPDVAPAVAHWHRGVSWEEAGVYDRLAKRIAEFGGERDGCLTTEDIIARFERLDCMFEQVQREQRLRSTAESSVLRGRERDGVLVHVGRDGATLFGGRGCHRMAAAIVADIPLLPAQLGVVHPQGLRELKRLRDPEPKAGS